MLKDETKKPLTDALQDRVNELGESVAAATENVKARLFTVPDPAGAPSKSDELVDAWFAKHFHGLGSMLDERLYNHVYAAKEDLKAELKKL